MRAIHYTFILLFLSTVFAVDKDKFKKCDQSSFCKRNRDFAEASGTSPYSIVDGSTSHSGSKLSATLINHNNQILFKLDLISYEDNTFRLQISEKSPLHPRYSVNDVIQSTAKRITWNPSNTFGDVKIEITPSPFRIDFFVGGEKIISTNNQGHLNIEHYREKLASQEESDQKPADEQEHEQSSKFRTISDYNAWEESFSTHRDSKPRGPSSIGLDFTFVDSNYIYGIPEHADSLPLKTTRGDAEHEQPYRLYNLDVFEYELNSPMSLYGAVPLIISHRPAKTSAVFWLNAAETFIDVSRKSKDTDVGGSHTHWMSESGIIDVFFFLGPSPKDIFRQYAKVTGYQFLPPQFSLGYHQCRWNYNDEEDVSNVDKKMDEHDLPYDVIWLDIEHTNSKKYMTWDPTHFPTPQKMQEELAAKGRKMVAIIDPHIKRDNDWAFHKEAESGNHYVKKHDGSVYEGWCWSGSSSWLDFVNPAVRAWWASKLSYSEYQGSTKNLHVWNDMNEPSVFNGPEITMHKDALHLDGTLEHREVHNMYGYYMTLATYDGLVDRNPEKNERPFILTRSVFAGSQRVAAIWTGDNMAEWSHLAAMSPMLLSLSISGIHFSGADVGGFFKNPEPELLVRWYQASAFVPFFRAHAHIETKRREPYLLTDPYLSVAREAIRVRYSLLPLWYTVFEESSRTGYPVLRPLWAEFPEDQATFGIDDQFLVGSSLLVKPITAKDTSSADVFLPGQEAWYDLVDYKPFFGNSGTVRVDAPLAKIPVFIRSGSIIPRKMRARRSSTQMQNDPVTLIVALDSHQKAEGDLYIDDGVSFDYRKGEFVRIKFKFAEGRLEADVENPSGLTIESFVERIIIVGAPSSLKAQQAQLNVGGSTSSVSISVLSQHSVSFLKSSVNHVIRYPAAPLDKSWTLSLS